MIVWLFAAVSTAMPVSAEEDLAKQSQNPLGTVISAPFENNFYFNTGPSDSLAYVLNMKPVYPVNLGDWNLINRFILPAIYSEGQDGPVPPDSEFDAGYAGIIKLAQGSEFGLGDLTYQAFFSPAKPRHMGLGPGARIYSADSHFGEIRKRQMVRRYHRSSAGHAGKVGARCAGAERLVLCRRQRCG